MHTDAFQGLISQVFMVLMLPLAIIPMFLYWVFFQKKY